jgi:NAD(P)-dependent dehydrogenase (short-subunit alcohol dehydrogenase family)
MNGVYVIVGGAGGVGEALTIHLVEAFQAQVIWLGRRELDSAIEAKLDGVACLGPRPLYVQADAADAASLGQAVGWIKARYPRIDGVVSAALELADRAIFNMDEATFRRVLRSKVDVSCNIAHLFAREPLDFLLFFSSMQSFGRPPGQSNYCAGSTFVDAFSAQLGSRPGAVRTINWGYWGHAGAAASPEVQARMADAGIGSIDPVRGIAALDELLTGDARQLAFVVRLGPGVMDAFLDEQDDAAGPARSGSAPALLRKLRDRHMKVAAE